MSRKTKQKEAILKVLRGKDNHPTAQWIHEQVRQQIPRISLGTVYRDLKSLKKECEISELDCGHESHFDLKAGNHYHFHCQQCGAISNVDEPIDTELDRRVAQKYQLDVAHHQLDFYGLCLHCRKTSDSRKKQGKEG